jgi:nucleoside-diphosphate-sugar epimerase
VVRPFTVYGEGQDPVFPFANIARQFRERRNPVTVWGTGNQVRDFIHVTDVVRAVITMAEKEIGGPVNLCTGRAVSLRELIAMFARESGHDPDIRAVDKPEGLPYRVGDPQKLLDFCTPAVSLEEGVFEALKEGP